MKRLTLATIAAAAAFVVFAAPSSTTAKVLEFKVTKVESPAFEGRTFGAVGAYQKITARVRLAVDPALRQNSGVVDIALAPRNAQGLVEFESDVLLLRPVDLTKGNGRLFYDVNNRGNTRALDKFNDKGDAPNDPKTAAHAGNGFLMNQGYVIMWSGWQSDVAPGDDRILLRTPKVAGVTGTSLEEFIFDNVTSPAIGRLSYPAADLNPALAKLTVRNLERDARATPADLKWTYKDADAIEIARPAGYGKGAIYEFTYPAKDPAVMGLGFAATRDIVAFLRRDAADPAGNANPLAAGGRPAMQYAIAFGSSQSGRYLRNLLYEGFNEDEIGRMVFDGLMPHIGGSRKTFTNYRWAQPGRYSRQHEDHNFPGDEFPFTYAVTTDKLTGKTDGLLAKCLATNTCPKVIQTDTGTEIWQARGSLVTTDTEGKPIDLPANVRTYLIASAPHGADFGAVPTASANCQMLVNPINTGAPLRALLVAMDRWVSDGTLPPSSRYPSHRDGSLVDPQALIKDFPAIPGLNYVGNVNGIKVRDLLAQPPKDGAAYPVFVAKVDADGNDVPGIRLPTVEVPLATYMGWNFRKPDNAPGELCGTTGSYIAFAKTKDERLAAKDSRLSIEERYPTHAAYVAAVTRSANQLVQDRLMLSDDAKYFIETAVKADIGRPKN